MQRSRPRAWPVLPSLRMFTRALVRPPAATFAQGLTTAGLGLPDLSKALLQHARYVAALEECGLAVITLPPDPAFPDSTFVEDTAILVPDLAIVTRPGASSRAGETAAVRRALVPLFEELREIEPPGTLDGGDVCVAGEHAFIGVSERTNPEGARQLAGLLVARGFDSTIVDVRGSTALLHLKSGLAWVGGRRLIAVVARAEDYAANCVLLGDRVLVAAGFPKISSTLRELGLRPFEIDTSEFRKMDGGPSCLSLRF